MLAAVLKDVNQLVLEDIPKPEPGPTQVVVDVKACGICATDHKAVRGKRKVHFPRILGHEVAGVIDSVGSVVSKFKPGDAVIVSPRGYCGLCQQCRLGFYHYCEDTFSTGGDGGDRFLPGGFAEYMVTEQRNVFPKPADISFAAAALTEPLAGSWKGVIQYSNLRIGEDVVAEGTFYVFLNVSGFRNRRSAGQAIDSGADFARLLRDQAGVNLVPGAGFGVPWHVRLSFAASMESLQEGMDRIERFVNR